MDFSSINNYLERFKNITPPKQSLRRAIAEAVEVHTKVSVPISDIEVRDNIAYIHNAHGALKSEIRAKCPFIINEVGNILPNTTIRDIR